MKTTNRALAAILILNFYTGCVTWASNMNKISEGMTKRDVVAILGNPESTASPGHGVQILRYNLAIPGNWQEHYVKLIDGKVDSYGKIGDFASTKDPTLNLNIKGK